MLLIYLLEQRHVYYYVQDPTLLARTREARLELYVRLSEKYAVTRAQYSQSLHHLSWYGFDDEDFTERWIIAFSMSACVFDKNLPQL